MNTSLSFPDDLQFLDRHVQSVVLGESEPGRIIVVPEYQARTMTSSTGHSSQFSFGWINYRRIASIPAAADPNLFGGEDRLWLGPEGSQYSLFFEPGAPMTLANWRVPAAIDMPRFRLVQQTATQIEMQHEDHVVNYSGFRFDFHLNRQVQWRARADSEKELGVTLPEEVWHVAHSSQNTITNSGRQPWFPASGLPAAWILGMYKPSPAATVVIPFVDSLPDQRAAVVTSEYFGQPDSNRLWIDHQRNLICFLGDGQFRSKLGVSFGRATDTMGSWDAHNGCLTIVKFGLPDSADPGYTNNLWKTDVDPYGGDVVNTYNDGPNESGGMLGPFYELESLSPALALAAGGSYTHVHHTIHLQGDKTGIDEVAAQVFGISASELERVFDSRP